MENIRKRLNKMCNYCRSDPENALIEGRKILEDFVKEYTSVNGNLEKQINGIEGVDPYTINKMHYIRKQTNVAVHESGIAVTSSIAKEIYDDLYSVIEKFSVLHENEINDIMLSQNDKRILNEIIKTFEDSNVANLLRQHDFSYEYHKATIEKIYRLWDKLDKPSFKADERELESQIRNLHNVIEELKWCEVRSNVSIGDGRYYKIGHDDMDDSNKTQDEEEKIKRMNKQARRVWKVYLEFKPFFNYI